MESAEEQEKQVCDLEGWTKERNDKSIAFDINRDWSCESMLLS